jgi:hypothetical protein
VEAEATASRHQNKSPDEVVSNEQKAREDLFQEQQNRAVLNVNRRLLKAYFGNLIGDRDVVYSYAVLKEDQRTRASWFLWSLAVFILAGLVVDLNATSWHGFYSTRIGQTWIDEVPGLGRNIPLAQLETTNAGRPYHLISGTLQLMGRIRDGGYIAQDHFLFSKLYCGSDRLTYARTSEYMDGAFRLDDAIAVSGAAVTPAQTKNPLLLALLTLANVRLGQWVANPLYGRRSRWLSALGNRWPVTPFRVLFSAWRTAEARPSCFVTDGGHHENLGVEPLLQRRCRLIIACDAGQDGDYDFADLAKLVRWARIKHGIALRPIDESTSVDLSPLIPTAVRKPHAGSGIDLQQASEVTPPQQPKWSSQHHVVLKIQYPADSSGGPESGYLIYVKSSMTGDEPFELIQFKRSNAAFPHDPTADQFFDPARFESYRQLGYHVADSVCKCLGLEVSDERSSDDIDRFIERLLATTGPSRDRTLQPAAQHTKPDMAATEEMDIEAANQQVTSLIEKLRAGSSRDDEAARLKFKELGSRSMAATRLLLKTWQDKQLSRDNVWLHKTVLEVLLDRPKERVSWLRKIIASDADPRMRLAAIWFLREFACGRYGVDPSQVRDALTTALSDKSAAVRAAAAKTLRSLGTGEPTIKEALQQPKRAAVDLAGPPPLA